MAVNSWTYRGTLAADTNLHPSPSIWGDCPVASIKENPTLGTHFFEDFQSFGKTAAVATNLGRYEGDVGAYISYEDTSCTILPLTGFNNGVIRFSDTATGSKAAILEYGGGVAATGGFLYTDGSGPKLWFEARVKFGSITDSKQNTFIGLAQSACAVVPAAATSITTLFDSGTTVGQVDKIGFEIVTGSGNGALLKAVHGKVSVAETVVGTATTIADTSTWYKIGFVADFNDVFHTTTALLRKKVRWFINGVETNSITDTSVASFPTAKQLTPTFHVQTVTTTAITMDMDYWRCAQVNAA